MLNFVMHRMTAVPAPQVLVDHFRTGRWKVNKLRKLNS